MSGVGSVQGQYAQMSWITSSANEAYASRLSKTRDPGEQTGISQQMEAVLDQAMDSAGIDQDTQDNLKADLGQALEELFSGGSTPPNPDDVKQTVDTVLDKYGLNGEDVFGRLRPPGGRPPAMGPPPGGGGGLLGQLDTEDTSQTDLLKTLLAKLSSSTESADDSGSETGLTPQELAQRVLDTLFGFDVQA